LPKDQAITDTQIQFIIQTEILVNHTAAPNNNNLYVVFAPPGDVVTANGKDSVTGFAAYHSHFFDRDTLHTDYYVVIPDPGAPNAANPANSLQLARFQQLTTLASAEMADAITDPIAPNGWVLSSNQNKLEISDIGAGESYTQDGYQVQSLWSNNMGGPAQAPGSAPDLTINNMSPPAVDGFSKGPVATFVDADPTLKPTDFEATVFTVDASGTMSQDWAATVTGGVGGVYTVNATAPGVLKDGLFGTPLLPQGLFVEVYDKAHGGPTTGAPAALRFAPFAVSPPAAEPGDEELRAVRQWPARLHPADRTDLGDQHRHRRRRGQLADGRLHQRPVQQHDQFRRRQWRRQPQPHGQGRQFPDGLGHHDRPGQRHAQPGQRGHRLHRCHAKG
jgi:hypothetical protein